MDYEKDFDRWNKIKQNLMHMAFYFDYDLHTMLIFQFKSYDSRRLVRKMGTVSDYLYTKTKKAVIHFLK